VSMLKLGKLLMERRGGTGIREFAKFLGISPATLSRVENGNLPDIDTFSKTVTAWALILRSSYR